MMPCPTCGSSDARNPFEDTGEMFALRTRLQAIEAETIERCAAIANHRYDICLIDGKFTEADECGEIERRIRALSTLKGE